MALSDHSMLKPIALDELTAQLRATHRRLEMGGDDGAEVEHGILKLSPSRRIATLRGEQVALTNNECSVLETLLRKKNQIFSRAQLEEALYGWGEAIDSNTVEVYIHYLRRKLGANVIQTVRGVGYQLGPMQA
jgi:DNA-binding response OmpR family regulator